MRTSKYNTYYYWKNENFFNHCLKLLEKKWFVNKYKLWFDERLSYLVWIESWDEKYIDTSTNWELYEDYGVLNSFFWWTKYTTTIFNWMYFLSDQYWWKRMSQYFASSANLYIYVINNIDNIKELPLFSNADLELLNKSSECSCNTKELQTTIDTLLKENSSLTESISLYEKKFNSIKSIF